MIIGFCTSCMNRRWQLEQTLEANLATLRGTRHFVALCDYNSQDNLEELVRRHSDDVRNGTLLYFATKEPASFHMSIAKNTAHRLALTRRPDVLFNLDADNFISSETVKKLESVFGNSEATVFHSWARDWLDGSFGRIALRANDWQTTGGYDESFGAMAFQDVDMILRCRALGFSYQQWDDGVRSPILNSPTDKLANAATLPSGADPTTAFMALSAQNLLLSFKRPIRLKLQDQRRFRGKLNFEAETTV